MKKKRMIVLLMCIAVFGLLGGCSRDGNKSVEDADSITLKVIFPYVTNAPKAEDTEKVERALSEIAQEKIGVNVDLQPISYSSWSEQFNLLMSGGEKADLIFSGPSHSSLSTVINKGYYIEMDELLEAYGQGVLDAVGEYIAGGQVDGVTYAVPTIHDMAAATGVIFLQEYVDKYQINPESIKTWEDLTAVLKTIKEGEGENFYPLFLNGSQYTSLTTTFYDSLGDNLGTLSAGLENTEVVNIFETEEYRERVALVRSWYEAGYINRDAATTNITLIEAVKTGNIACWPSRTKPGAETIQESSLGEDVTVIQIGESIVTTSSLQSALWSIPYQAEDPVKSMMLLNLMYSDEEFYNTLCWGIEGEHYVKTGDGHITYPEGTNSENSGWAMNIGWLLGNEFLSYVWEGTDLDIWEQTKAFNEASRMSPAVGFVYEVADVATEYAACSSIKTEYQRALETGSMELERLDEMNQQLELAGLQEIIEEKQKQLDQYLAGRN